MPSNDQVDSVRLVVLDVAPKLSAFLIQTRQCFQHRQSLKLKIESVLLHHVCHFQLQSFDNIKHVRCGHEEYEAI